MKTIKLCTHHCAGDDTAILYNNIATDMLIWFDDIKVQINYEYNYIEKGKVWDMIMILTIEVPDDISSRAVNLIKRIINQQDEVEPELCIL